MLWMDQAIDKEGLISIKLDKGKLCPQCRIEMHYALSNQVTGYVPCWKCPKCRNEIKLQEANSGKLEDFKGFYMSFA
jgi:ssDNA-binding Zn-finger/Zn-ribbon topoisomerase 1